MENSCDRFWNWGRAPKKMKLTECSNLDGGFCSITDKESSVVDEFSSKIPSKGGLWKVKHRKYVASIPRSQKIAETNLSKLGSACNGLALPCETSCVEVNLLNILNSRYKISEGNRINSPASVVQTSTSDADTISCNPHDDLLCSSGENLFEGIGLCEREESARARRMGQKASYAEGIRTWCMEGPLHCSNSEDEDAEVELLEWSIDEETRNLKPAGVSEATSKFMGEYKHCHYPISNGGNEIQTENSEPFVALNMLAAVAVWVLENGYEGEDKSKISRGHRKIFNPSGDPSLHKNVIKGIKSDSDSLPPQLPVHAEEFFPSLSEHLFTSKLGSPECSLKREHDQDMRLGFDDKNRGENLNVRSSKRSRSQYLNCKYPDSILEPLKKGNRR